jgi:deoxyribonuclease-4
MKIKNLLFGTAGIPLQTHGTTTDGIIDVSKLGLDAMELEFVHSVNISKDKTEDVRRTAEKNNIVLTCHGQYYINLNAKESAKIKASKQRILNAANIANLCGAYSLCFHAAFYMGQDSKKVYDNVKKQLNEIMSELKKNENKIWVRPEVTGKQSQFGDLGELLKLSEEMEQVMPCVDFSHMHARYNGKYNTYEEFCGILGKVEKSLGRSGLNNMHIHVSGINYGEKGEKNHLILKESDFQYADLLKAFKEFNVKGVVICESPNIEQDALLLKKTFNRLNSNVV